jgi:hypothetical protein
MLLMGRGPGAGTRPKPSVSTSIIQLRCINAMHILPSDFASFMPSHAPSAPTQPPVGCMPMVSTSFSTCALTVCCCYLCPDVLMLNCRMSMPMGTLTTSPFIHAACRPCHSHVTPPRGILEGLRHSVGIIYITYAV